MARLDVSVATAWRQRRVSGWLRLWVGILAIAGTCRGYAETSLPQVDVFAPTAFENPAPGRSEALKLEFSSLNLDALSPLMQRLRPVLPTLRPGDVLTVPFYLSAHRSAEEREAMVAAARQELEKSFPRARIRIQVRFLAEEQTRVEKLAARVETSLETLARDLPADSPLHERVQQARAANARALQETAQARRDGTLSLTDPSRVRKAVKHVAAIKAVTTLITRWSQHASIGAPLMASLHGDVSALRPLLAGISLVGLDTAVQYYATRFESQLARLFSDHRLPLPRKPEFLKKWGEAYQHSTVVKLAKGTAGGLALWGLAHPVMLAWLGYWNQPGLSPGVTTHYLAATAAASVGSSLVYIAGMNGLERLRQKGWITQPVIELTIRALGMVGMATTLALTIPGGKILVPYLLGSMWIPQAAFFVASWIFPHRTNRLTLVDTAIGNRADLNELEALEATRRVGTTKREVASTLREILAYRRLAPANPGGLTALAQRLRRTFASCVSALSSLGRPAR